MKNNIGIIIQARSSSTRLPNKIFLPLPYGSKTTVLDNVVSRCKLANDNIIIATTTNKADNKIVDFADERKLKYFRGSEDDVLKRYLDTAKKFELDIIVRVTSDCPCIDPDVIKGVVNTLLNSKADYSSNVIIRTFPHGLDCEAFTIDALINADKNETDIKLREHVTQPIIRDDSYSKVDYIMKDNADFHDIRVTIDNESDYTLLCIILDLLKDNFRCKDIVQLFIDKPYLRLINKDVYHKKVFTTLVEEINEAKELLKLYGMSRVTDLLNSKTTQKVSDLQEK